MRNVQQGLPLLLRLFDITLTKYCTRRLLETLNMTQGNPRDTTQHKKRSGTERETPD